MPSIQPLSLAQIDLNLLVALDALLAEASVSAAARRLGVGQPAASHALARLRELLGDPLLVRVGRRMVLTTRAEALRAPLGRLLCDARKLLTDELEFDPATSTRAFVLICPDLLAPLIPALLTSLRERAPHVRLEVELRVAEYPRVLEHGEADVALVPMPERGPGLLRHKLGSVGFCVLARAGHPALCGGRLTLKRWLSHPHIVVRTGNASQSFVERALERDGRERDVGLIVPSFFSALIAVAETDLFFAAPRELVVDLAPRFGLEIHPIPLRLPELPVAALWHERAHQDPGHRFFRTRLVAAIERMLG